MPYRNAHWWIVAILIVTGIAFWRDYFGVLGAAPWAFHLHGITATLWIVLLGLQSWTSATRRFPLHRIFGRTSLLLFPLFIAGGFGVEHSMAAATLESPFYRLHGLGLGWSDLLAMATVGWLYFNALQHRRSVQRHARFMLATPLMLVSPALGRIGTHFVPGLIIKGPQDFPLFADSYHLANLIAAIAAFWLYRAAPKHGLPFLVCGVVVVAQSIGFAIAPYLVSARALFVMLGQLPAASFVLTGLAVGIAVTWGGWIAGQRSGPAAATA